MTLINIVQLVIALLITVLGIATAIFGNTQIGIISASAGIIAGYITIKELRNQADQ